MTAASEAHRSADIKLAVSGDVFIHVQTKWWILRCRLISLTRSLSHWTMLRVGRLRGGNRGADVGRLFGAMVGVSGVLMPSAFRKRKGKNGVKRHISE